MRVARSLVVRVARSLAVRVARSLAVRVARSLAVRVVCCIAVRVARSLIRMHNDPFRPVVRIRPTVHMASFFAAFAGPRLKAAPGSIV